MSPRKSAVEAGHTRQRIVEHALVRASTDGLDGLTIGRLATDLAMSKAGVLGHFGTKEGLQLAVIDAATQLFTREVADRVRGTAPGLPWLRVACEAWVSYLERDVLPGGCFFTAVAAEFDDRDGPVRETIAAMIELWLRDLRIHLRRAISAGDLPPDTDADQVIYEIYGAMLALNHFLRLHRDRSAPDRTRRALHRLLDPQQADKI